MGFKGRGIVKGVSGKKNVSSHKRRIPDTTTQPKGGMWIHLRGRKEVKVEKGTGGLGG